jgi:hemerythrin superfamily protein
MDAINLLKQDHRTVEKLFQEFRRSSDAHHQADVCQQACRELDIHSAIEEQCFYPGVRSVAALEDMVELSLIEHDQVKQLCTRLRGMSAGAAQIRSTMAELEQAVTQHVKEEEGHMFPKVRDACDQQWLLGIATAMEQQKAQLQASAEREPSREEVRQPSPARTQASG